MLLLRLLVILPLVSLTSFAQGIALSVSSDSASLGTVVTLNLSLSTTPGNQPASVQWTLGYSESDFTSVDIVAGPAAIAASKSVACASSVGGSACLAWGLNSNVIPNGVLATVALTLSNSTANPTSSVLLTNNLAVAPDITAIPASSTAGLVTILQPISVAVIPATVTLGQGQKQQFIATVQNSTSASVTWSLSPAAGTISSSGLYTAPSTITNSQTVTVVATSTDDPTRSAMATINLIPPIAVSVSPASVTVAQGQTQQFTATVQNAPDQSVTWSLSSPLGTLSPTGLYTAPALVTISRTVTVTATSTVDVTKSAIATITLTPTAGSSGSAQFVALDTATQGNWKGVYGGDGYNVITNALNYPSYVTVTPSGNSSYSWAGSTTDPRGLEKVLTPSDRIAACWYSGDSFSINLNFSDGSTHKVALYVLDWDDFWGRTERVDILDANGTLLNSQVASNFHGGQYLVWNLSGHVTVRFANLNPISNAVLSGLFFGGS